MDFSNRIKKEMSEGIVRALLADAGYCVISTGIEDLVREVTHLSSSDYRGLSFPAAMRALPDITVIDRESSKKYLVEVKYRADWSKAVIDGVADQVKQFGEIVLVCIWGNAPTKKELISPARYLRCMSLRYVNGVYEIELPRKGGWIPVDNIVDETSELWWKTLRLEQKFSKLTGRTDEQTLMKAVTAITGILNHDDEFVREI